MPPDFEPATAPAPTGPGNFDTVGALVTADQYVDEMLLSIDEIFDTGDEAAPDRRGESELMPTIAMLIALCTECQDCPVEPAEVQQWRSEYLTRFDARGGQLFGDPASFAARRRVIEETFSRLEALSCRFHPDLAGETRSSLLN